MSLVTKFNFTDNTDNRLCLAESGQINQLGKFTHLMLKTVLLEESITCVISIRVLSHFVHKPDLHSSFRHM